MHVRTFERLWISQRSNVGVFKFLNPQRFCFSFLEPHGSD